MMRPIHFTVAGAAIILLAGCQGMQPRQQMAAAPAAPQGMQQQETMVWVRTDGQRGSGNPELERQYRMDSEACLSGGTVTAQARACMEARGYAYVPQSQADATLQYFAARAGNS